MSQDVPSHSLDSCALVAMGANLESAAGRPEETLLAALEMLSASEVFPVEVSAFYLTPCFPAGNGPDFVNAALLVKTTKAPLDLLATLHKVEAAFGRERNVRWDARTLDIDLIAYDDQVLPDRETFDHWQTLALDEQKLQAPEQLILPHPRLQDRAFVLIPLADVAHDWRHPVLGKTVIEMLQDLPKEDRNAVKRLVS